MKKAIKKAKLSRREMRLKETKDRSKNHLEIIVRSENDAQSELMQSEIIKAATRWKRLLGGNLSFEMMILSRNFYDQENQRNR